MTSFGLPGPSRFDFALDAVSSRIVRVGRDGMTEELKSRCRLGKVVCAVCEEPITGVRRAADHDGFAHRSGRAPHSEPESNEHYVAKHLLADWARAQQPDWLVEVERALDVRRPDVLATDRTSGLKAALQFQRVGLEIEMLDAREGDCRRDGATMNWLFAANSLHCAIDSRRAGRDWTVARLGSLTHALYVRGGDVMLLDAHASVVAYAVPLGVAGKIRARYLRRDTGPLRRDEVVLLLEPLARCELADNGSVVHPAQIALRRDAGLRDERDRRLAVLREHAARQTRWSPGGQVRQHARRSSGASPAAQPSPLFVAAKDTRVPNSPAPLEPVTVEHPAERDVSAAANWKPTVPKAAQGPQAEPMPVGRTQAPSSSEGGSILPWLVVLAGVAVWAVVVVLIVSLLL